VQLADFLHIEAKQLADFCKQRRAGGPLLHTVAVHLAPLRALRLIIWAFLRLRSAYP